MSEVRKWGIQISGGIAVVSTINISTDEYTSCPAFYYWHEPMELWENLIEGTNIPVGKEVALAPSWINEHNEVIKGYIYLTVTKPDGTTVTPDAVENQGKEAEPGDGHTVQFAPVTFDQEGNYTINVEITRKPLEEVPWLLYAGIATVVVGGIAVIIKKWR